MLYQSSYENKKSNVLVERLRVVEAAAAIVEEVIRSALVVNTDTSYPSVNQMLDNVNENYTAQSNILYYSRN